MAIQTVPLGQMYGNQVVVSLTYDDVSNVIQTFIEKNTTATHTITVDVYNSAGVKVLTRTVPPGTNKTTNVAAANIVLDQINGYSLSLSG